jgi:hypothetical protein
MRIVLLASLCLLLALGIQAQTAEKETTEKEVKKLSLGKEDKEGNIIEDIDVFNPKDIPIYCYIDLSSNRPTLVRMLIVAVKAKKLRPNSTVINVQYKTKTGENGVTFNAKPGEVWATGDYRVDVFLDGKLSKSKEFKVSVEE